MHGYAMIAGSTQRTQSVDRRISCQLNQVKKFEKDHGKEAGCAACSDQRNKLSMLHGCLSQPLAPGSICLSAVKIQELL